MTHNQVVQIVSNWFKINPKVKIVSHYSFDFPVPDIQVQTVENEIIQIECKPTTDNKREYITGLGQAIAYCTQSTYSYLALPLVEMQKYQTWFWPEFIGLLGVEPNNVIEIRKPIKSPVNDSKQKAIKRGYAYYRDLSIKEIYYILKALSKRMILEEQEIIDDVIWQEIIKHRSWKSSKSSNLLNIKLLLRDLKLFNFKEGKILDNGFELINIGDKNDNEQLKEFGRKLFLIDGNFIDIVAIIQEMIDEVPHFNDMNSFKVELSKRIILEKLASNNTDVFRDLRDVIRILTQLDIIKHSKKSELFSSLIVINWKKLIPFIKNR